MPDDEVRHIGGSKVSKKSGYTIAANTRGLTDAAKDLRKKIRLSMPAKKRAVSAGGKVMKGAVQKALNKKPTKSYEKLQALGHPYARRHGKISQTKVGYPWYGIYKREGKLFNALVGRRMGESFFVGFDDSLLPKEERYAIRGTKTRRSKATGKRIAGLLPRNVLYFVSREPEVRKKVQSRMTKVWKQGVFK